MFPTWDDQRREHTAVRQLRVATSSGPVWVSGPWRVSERIGICERHFADTPCTKSGMIGEFRPARYFGRLAAALVYRPVRNHQSFLFVSGFNAQSAQRSLLSDGDRENDP